MKKHSQLGKKSGRTTFITPVSVRNLRNQMVKRFKHTWNRGKSRFFRSQKKDKF